MHLVFRHGMGRPQGGGEGGFWQRFYESEYHKKKATESQGGVLPKYQIEVMFGNYLNAYYRSLNLVGFRHPSTACASSSSCTPCKKDATSCGARYLP